MIHRNNSKIKNSKLIMVSVEINYKCDYYIIIYMYGVFVIVRVCYAFDFDFLCPLFTTSQPSIMVALIIVNMPIPHLRLRVYSLAPPLLLPHCLRCRVCPCAGLSLRLLQCLLVNPAPTHVPGCTCCGNGRLQFTSSSCTFSCCAH